MTRWWSYDNEAADGRVSHPAVAAYPIKFRTALEALKTEVGTRTLVMKLVGHLPDTKTGWDPNGGER
jgi:hypothetical protein